MRGLRRTSTCCWNSGRGSRAELLAWKGGTQLYRAILALEAGKAEEFETRFQTAQESFTEAKKLGPKNPAVAAIVGGSFVFFGDRLPEKYRAAAWTSGYDNYQILWEMQGRSVEQLPLHIKGELLAGLAQASERTGHKEELAGYLDKIVEVLPDTEYERVAKQWKADPLAAANSNISCKSCHAAGRLSARMAKLAEKE